MSKKPNYGIDSPAIVGFELVVSVTGFVVALAIAHPFGSIGTWIGSALGIYFLHSALQMLYYSKAGKLKLREQLLDLIDWSGDETVLDVGCGRGLLLIGAARRLTTGTAIGVDLWLPHAVSRNEPESVLENAGIEGVAARVEVQNADVRRLPFEDTVFDVAVSNFVLHEMWNPKDREEMLRAIVRVLKPGGRLVLSDFIFTRECVAILRESGAGDAARSRNGGVYFWISAFLTLGTFRLYVVTATRDK